MYVPTDSNISALKTCKNNSTYGSDSFRMYIKPISVGIILVKSRSACSNFIEKHLLKCYRRYVYIT